MTFNEQRHYYLSVQEGGFREVVSILFTYPDIRMLLDVPEVLQVVGLKIKLILC